MDTRSNLRVAPPDGPTTITILVVDGHRLAAEAIVGVLDVASGLEVVGVVGDADAAVARARRLGAAVALVHDPLNDEPVASLITRLRAAAPDTRVLVLASRAEDARIADWVRAGAAGCVTEASTSMDLVRAIELVHAGEVLFPPSALLGLLRADQARHAPRDERPAVSPREVEVLEGLTAGLSIAEIAARLGISPHTARHYLKSASTALGARSRTEAVILALRAGIIALPADIAEPALHPRG